MKEQKNCDQVQEALELVDLGDAAVETRQISPLPQFQDSIVGWGEWG